MLHITLCICISQHFQKPLVYQCQRQQPSSSASARGHHFWPASAAICWLVSASSSSLAAIVVGQHLHQKRYYVHEWALTPNLHMVCPIYEQNVCYNKFFVHRRPNMSHICVLLFDIRILMYVLLYFFRHLMPKNQSA